MTQGYNIRLKINGKTLIASTQDDLTVSPKTKESITKDSQGVKLKEIVGHDVTFKCSGIIDMTGGSASVLDNDDIIDLALAKGEDAVFPLTYMRSDGTTYYGDCIITGYSESTPAAPDSEATYSLDFRVSGELSTSQS